MMNEFIVWDKKNRSFEDDSYYNLKPNGVLFRLESWEFKDCSETHSFFKGIGIKDINNKKIYADSSIVEFRNEEPEDYEEIVWRGYYNYNINTLRYTVIDLKTKETVYCASLLSRGEIVDTIQENKLGLINE